MFSKGTDEIIVLEAHKKSEMQYGTNISSVVHPDIERTEDSTLIVCDECDLAFPKTKSTGYYDFGINGMTNRKI